MCSSKFAADSSITALLVLLAAVSGCEIADPEASECALITDPESLSEESRWDPLSKAAPAETTSKEPIVADQDNRTFTKKLLLHSNILIGGAPFVEEENGRFK